MARADGVNFFVPFGSFFESVCKAGYLTVTGFFKQIFNAKAKRRETSPAVIFFTGGVYEAGFCVSREIWGLLFS